MRKVKTQGMNVPKELYIEKFHTFYTDNVREFYNEELETTMYEYDMYEFDSLDDFIGWLDKRQASQINELQASNDYLYMMLDVE